MKKLTNEIIDERLKNINIKRIDNYINDRVKINFQCLVKNCNHIWMARTSHILNDSGCPVCDIKSQLLTNDIIDKRLGNRDIERIGSYIKVNIKIAFKCLTKDCGRIWYAKPNNILNGKGCPKCSLKKNEKLLSNFLSNNNIIFDSQYLVKLPIGSRSKRVDFYIPLYNLIIEYNGVQHYEPRCFGSLSIKQAEKAFNIQQNRDNALRKYCIDHSINLLEIDGREYIGEKLVQFLINFFNDIRLLKEENNKYSDQF